MIHDKEGTCVNCGKVIPGNEAVCSIECFHKYHTVHATSASQEARTE